MYVLCQIPITIRDQHFLIKTWETESRFITPKTKASVKKYSKGVAYRFRRFKVSSALIVG